jgi:hypothetical protein
MLLVGICSPVPLVAVARGRRRERRRADMVGPTREGGVHYLLY